MLKSKSNRLILLGTKFFWLILCLYIVNVDYLEY